MTGIIFRGLDTGDFSILRFYLARAKRIIPALAVFCGVILTANFFYLNPVDFAALGKHISSSLGFVSNFTYWQESGYFDQASHEKWLLHTWSLSAEWQFYILYPIILLLLKQLLSYGALKISVLLLTIVGFLVSALTSHLWPDAAYYLLHTRAWEMLLGGVAFLYPLSLSPALQKASFFGGLGLIISSYALVDGSIPWPGIAALAPVFGTYLIIIANNNETTLVRLGVLQKIGLWSYSIYLWHWALVVLLVREQLETNLIWQLTAGIASICVGGSILLLGRETFGDQSMDRSINPAPTRRNSDL